MPCPLRLGAWHVFYLTEAEWRIHVSKLTIIVSDNGLSPGRRQAIICTNAEILLIEPLGRNSSEIFREIYTISGKKKAFENVVRKMTAILSQPQYGKVLFLYRCFS